MSIDSTPGITRDEALEYLKAHLKNEKLISHCLATEAIMRALAQKFEEDLEIWGLAGLLHDLDYEITGEDPSRHGEETARLLEAQGVLPAITDVIKKHNAEGLGL